MTFCSGNRTRGKEDQELEFQILESHRTARCGKMQKSAACLTLGRANGPTVGIAPCLQKLFDWSGQPNKLDSHTKTVVGCAVSFQLPTSFLSLRRAYDLYWIWQTRPVRLHRCHQKPKGVAKVGAARKLAARLYWMLRTQTRDPEIVRIESSPRVPLVGAS